MAKRGERRPHRVRFEYGNGVAGTWTFRTEAEADEFETEIRATAEARDLGGVVITRSVRDGGK